MSSTGTRSEERTLVGDEGREPSIPERATVRGRGDAIGRYVVLSPLGRGAMGVVLSAYDPELDRKVAIKLLRQAETGPDDTRTARLVREAQALARVSHANVVGVFDVGTIGTEVFVAMEFVDGVTLTEWMKTPRRARETLRALIDVGRGLAAVHEAGVVHRDVKPDNVMVDNGGRVRLMDLGLARTEGVPILDERPTESSGATSGGFPVDISTTGGLIGTPAYMAPEQFYGEPSDARSDQFSFCVMAWEVLYGKRPFEATTVPGLAMAVTQGRRAEPPPGHGVSHAVRRVLERGLERDPALRWPNLEALVVALSADPRRRWRWAGAIALVTAAVSTAAAYPFARDALRDRTCRAESGELVAAWSESRRVAIDQAIRGTGLPFSDRTADLVRERTDTWIPALADAAHDSCLARERGGPDAGTRWDRASHCLEERHTALEAQFELLEHPNPTVVGGAALAISNLPRPDRCTDASFLAARALPPLELQAEAQALGTRIAQVRAREAVGLYEQADETARVLVEEASQLGWAPLEARAQLVAGETSGSVGRVADSEQHYEAAYFAALRADEPEVGVRAANALVAGTMEARADYEGAARWGRSAEALLERLRPEERGILQAALLQNLARVAAETGELELALAKTEEARIAFETILGPDHPRLAGVHDRAGITLSTLGRYEKAIELHQRALGVRLAALGPGHPGVAASYNNLGTVQRQIGAVDDALDSHRRALEIQMRAHGPESLEVASSKNNIATVYLISGRYTDALDLLESAFRLTAAHLPSDHPRLATMRGNLGTVYQGLGRLEDARVEFRHALEIEEAARGIDHAFVADALNNLGAVEQLLENPKAAGEAHGRALAIREKALGPRHPDVAMSHLNLAAADRSLGHNKAALDHAQQAHEIWAEGLGDSHPYVAAAALERAENELVLGRFAEAAQFGRAAMAVCVAGQAPREWLAASKFVVARALARRRTDRAVARNLAIEARDILKASGPASHKDLDEIEDWLRKR